MSKQSTKDLMFRGWTAVRGVHEVLDESFNIIERHGLMNQDLLTRGRYAMREVKNVFEEWGMLEDVVNEIAQDIKTRLNTIHGFKVIDDTQKQEEQKEMPQPTPHYGTSYRLHQTPIIYKYTFPLTPGEFTLSLPDDASILDCQVQHGVGALWALLNPLHPVREVSFAVVGTGHAFPLEWRRMDYIATVQDDPYVWHIFRIEKSPTITPSTPGNQVQD